MKATRRVDGQWITEAPEDFSAWMWKHDGTEAVVIDGNKRYCGTEETAAKFRDAWAKESRKNDKRTAAMFIELDKILFDSEPPTSPISSAAYCEGESCLCSEIANCSGPCASL